MTNTTQATVDTGEETAQGEQASADRARKDAAIEKERDYLNKANIDAEQEIDDFLRKHGVSTVFGSSERYASLPIVQLQPGEIVPLSEIRDPDWVKHVKVWDFRDSFRLMHPGVWVEHFDLVKWIWTYSDYAGFDPFVITNIIFSSKDRFKSMFEVIMLMCIIFMERGNNVSKIINRSSPELADIVRSLRDIYNIKDSTSKGTNCRQVVTLARVAASYSWACCEVMPLCRHPVVSKARVDEFVRRNYPESTSDYPIHMCCVPFSAMIPTDVEHNTLVELFAAHVAYHIVLTKTINPLVRDKPPPPPRTFLNLSASMQRVRC